MRFVSGVRDRWPLLAGGSAAVLLGGAVLLDWPGRQSARPATGAQVPRTTNLSTPISGPPWRYGRTDARFTVVEYADLECPYCRAYFPLLRQWIDANPEVNWEWRHLPLSMHEPAASTEARLVECIGLTGRAGEFWKALSWVYAHTRGGGQGLPPDQHYPGMTPDVTECLGSDRAGRVIREQAAAAGRDGIAATPTLRLEDHTTGRALLLPGPVEGDALLSAMDLLASGVEASAAPNAPRLGGAAE